MANWIEWQLRSDCNAAMSLFACVTTQTWVEADARMMSLASAGNRPGCRLVSGSFNTISDGGCGVSRDATHRR